MTRKPSSAAIEQARAAERPTLIACRTHHRKGRPEPPGFGEDAWRPARRDGDRRRAPEHRLAPPALPRARRDPGSLARRGRTRQGGTARVGERAGKARRTAKPSTGRLPANCRMRSSKRCRRSARSISRRRRRSRPARPRKWRSAVINAATELTVGGSADLTHSNLTITKGMGRIARATSPAATSTTASASMAWRRR